MQENLVIVESPAKAKTIEKFLGKNFKVTSSYGHIRDLSKKNLGIDINNNYKPEYVVSEDKKKVVKELKKLVKDAKNIWLASDEDREGEAIAWHLAEELKLNKEKVKRIVFHEITKNAIDEAIKSPRNINESLVNAQQARRVLDRLVGFELSPILWKKVKPSLSAGRVQSVAVRLLVEREREIINYKEVALYKVTGIFIVKDNGKVFEFKAELDKKFDTLVQAEEFLKKCVESEFMISDVTTKPGTKSPSAPFTTSTLQQEASRKLGFSVSQTMTVAQRLYEAGKITYMRTDSVNLSNLALATAKNKIYKEYGENYHKARNYKTKSKGAQEAHEAIRPTYIDKDTVLGNTTEKKLYDLIWKRTVASQMSDAKLEKTSVNIEVSKADEKFIATGEVIVFDGFLKLYNVSADNDDEEGNKTLLPPLKKGNKLEYKIIEAQQRFSKHPPRYTEASLVKKLEELGIGRPSTYAPIISTIQNRGYVIKEDRPGKESEYDKLTLEKRKILKEKLTEIRGSEKAKLFPNDIGMVVNDFLVDNFKDILDFNFTASVEEKFDRIAEGEIVWTDMINLFYTDFHKAVEETLAKKEKQKGERILGEDPETGKQVSVRIGRYGPVAQIGESNNGDEKPRFASLLKGQFIETITLEEALELFKFPRILGTYSEKEVKVAIGRFGPYVQYDKIFASLKKNIDDPLTIELDRAIELIIEKQEKEKNKVIREFEEADIKILNGRWGPYISNGKKNYKIPKGYDPPKLSLEDCNTIIKEADNKKKK